MTVKHAVEDLVTALAQLEAEIACELDSECANTATASVSCRRCGATALLCQRHIDAYRRWFGKTRDNGLVVACKVCKVHMPSFIECLVVVYL